MVGAQQGELAVTAFQLQFDLDVPLAKDLVDADLVEVDYAFGCLVVYELLLALEIFEYTCLQHKVPLLVVVHDFGRPLLLQVTLMVVVLREHVVHDRVAPMSH